MRPHPLPHPHPTTTKTTTTTTTTRSEDPATTFVLVPGAWHLPSTFDLLRGELDARGRAGIAVKLPTTGPDPRGGLAQDAAAVRAAIEAVGGPVVVMAHSYGGIPATQAAAGPPERPTPDIRVRLRTRRGRINVHHPRVPDPDDTDALFPIGDDPRAQLYADVPGPVADAAIGGLVEQRVRPWVDRVTAAAWHTVPSTYIVTERDASLPVPLQEEMSARTKDVRRMATD